MVKIHFWREPESKAICMTVKGHARTAPKGADLVCASATMLVYTAAQAIRYMYKQGYTEKPRIKIREGNTKISVVPKDDYYAEVLHAFWVVQCGAHVLAHNYPEAVSLNHLTV